MQNHCSVTKNTNNFSGDLQEEHWFFVFNMLWENITDVFFFCNTVEDRQTDRQTDRLTDGSFILIQQNIDICGPLHC